MEAIFYPGFVHWRVLLFSMLPTIDFMKNAQLWCILCTMDFEVVARGIYLGVIIGVGNEMERAGCRSLPIVTLHSISECCMVWPSLAHVKPASHLQEIAWME